MKDIVSYETAVRLKVAGFPQPKPEAGQWWHNPDFGLFVVGVKWFADNREYKIFYPGTGRSVLKSEAMFLKCAFAPTATDILREMPSYFYIRKYKYQTKDIQIFSIFCEELEAGDDLLQIAKGVNENPAEAVAEAWLKLNEPREQKIARASKTWAGTDTSMFMKDIKQG